MQNKILILLLCLIFIGLGIIFINKNNSLPQSKEIEGAATNMVTSGSINNPGVDPVQSANNPVNSF